VCVLHNVERHCVCTAQCIEALCVYWTVWRGTVFVVHRLERCMCVLHSVERHCVCTAQSREVCVCVCTAQCRKPLCVYCTV